MAKANFFQRIYIYIYIYSTCQLILIKSTLINMKNMKLRREKKLYAIILLKILRCEKKTTAYLEIKK